MNYNILSFIKRIFESENQEKAVWELIQNHDIDQAIKMIDEGAVIFPKAKTWGKTTSKYGYFEFEHCIYFYAFMKGTPRYLGQENHQFLSDLDIKRITTAIARAAGVNAISDEMVVKNYGKHTYIGEAFFDTVL